MKEGDLIQQANGHRVASIADLRRAVRAGRDGTLEMKVIRSQAVKAVKLKLEKPGF